jgi:hypothetical protein
MKDKLTWAGDVKLAYEVATGTPPFETPGYFNDKHKTCRRIKFWLPREHLNYETLTKIQEAIQARRPNHSVFVDKWSTVSSSPWGGFGNVVVYYSMKDSDRMDHTVK